MAPLDETKFVGNRSEDVVVGTEESLDAVSAPVNGEPVQLDLNPLRPLRGSTLAISGFSETTRHLVPFDDPTVEVWVCNRLPLQPGFKRWDRHFDPHPLSWSKINHHEDNWRTYEEWLNKSFGESLIYLAALDPDTTTVPNAVPFPRDEVLADVKREYMASAIGWQLGLALLLHTRYGSPTRIELYGIDLRSAAEYEYQRPNAEWLCGIADGRGIEVVIPKESALLNADGRSPLYGFEIYSGNYGMGSMEKALEERIKEIDAKMVELRNHNNDTVAELATWNGALQDSKAWLERVVQYRRGGKL